MGIEDKGNFKPQPRSSPELTLSHDRFAVGSTLQRNPWAANLLEDFGKSLPHDLQSSLRVAYITADVMAAVNDLGLRNPFSQPENDAIILGGALQDIGRGFDPEEVREKVYSSGERWRDNPDAWQWDVVRHHPLQSHDLILASTGDPEEGVPYQAAQIAFLHHALKRLNPYPSPSEIPFDELDEAVQFGVTVVSAVDVAEAVSRNSQGEGRAYLLDEEFAGRRLSEIVQTELVVDETIAKLAAAHTLRLKGLSLNNL